MLVDDRRVNDDIDPPKVTAIFTNTMDLNIKQLAEGKGAALYTSIDSWEQRSPRLEDRRLSAELIDHLNHNLEFYHHALWWTMDPNRRYMLLDGYLAPESNQRSIASVVENRLIGIVGNSLVLPVARGNHLNPRFAGDQAGKFADLLNFYKLPSPVPSARVSLPTRGVFAEAVMGSCNACEHIDDSRFWRWEDSPIDEPPAIESASMGTRRAEPPNVQPTSFPTPIVSIQNAPSAPDPAGVRATLDALGKLSFPDITGLAGTQANAAAAYQQALDTAYKFGKEASVLAQQAAMLNAKDKALGAIDSAEAAGKISKEDAKQLRVSALKKMVGETPTDAKASSVADRLKVIDDQEAKGSITREKAAEFREQVMRGLDSEQASKTDEQKATTETIRKIPGESVESVETKDPSGASTRITAKPDTLGGAGGLLGQLLNIALTAAPPVKTVTATQRDPGWRACCALGWASSLDPTILGGHRKGGFSPGGPTGYVYTARVGLVDLGHVRDATDMTKFIYDALVSGAMRLDLYEGIVNIRAMPSDQTAMIDLAGAIAYVESWAHELSSWGG